MMWKNKPRLLIIDGRNLLWRTSDAFSDLYITKNGKQIVTGGIYGFLSILIKIHRKYGGKVIIAWEGKDNFRFKLFSNYKKRNVDDNFLELLEEINDQQTRLIKILKYIGVTQYRAFGCEADDIMGYFARDWTKNGTRQAFIYTGDGDLRQCVDAYISVVSPKRGGEEVVYDPNKVKEKDLVWPKYVADLKALAGDTSDSIPGVRGIGSVNASNLINKYGHVKAIIRKAKKNKWEFSDKLRQKIIDSEKEILLYKKLTKLKKFPEFKKIKRKKNKKKVIKSLFYYKFSSLVIPNELFSLMQLGKEK